jgi:hypothetical protein
LSGILGEKVAVLNNQTAGLKAQALHAQADLARITGRPYAVPVIHGVARPDLSKSDSQFLRLTSDTKIAFPKLSEGQHENWTLTIAQNSVGQHQITTSPWELFHGNNLNAPPGSSRVCHLTTDSFGTRLADMDCGYNAPSSPTSK